MTNQSPTARTSQATTRAGWGFLRVRLGRTGAIRSMIVAVENIVGLRSISALIVSIK